MAGLFSTPITVTTHTRSLPSLSPSIIVCSWHPPLGNSFSTNRHVLVSHLTATRLCSTFEAERARSQRRHGRMLSHDSRVSSQAPRLTHRCSSCKMVRSKRYHEIQSRMLHERYNLCRRCHRGGQAKVFIQELVSSGTAGDNKYRYWCTGCGILRSRKFHNAHPGPDQLSVADSLCYSCTDAEFDETDEEDSDASIPEPTDQVLSLHSEAFFSCTALY